MSECQFCGGDVEFGMTEQGFRGFVHTSTGEAACPPKRSTEEILRDLEADGVLRVVCTTVETSEAVVEVDARRVGSVVEWRGVHRQFGPTASLVLAQLRRFQEEAWVHGRKYRADELALVGFDLGSRWGAHPVVMRAIDSVFPKGWLGGLSPISRCGIHGDSTATGRCLSCDAATAATR